MTPLTEAELRSLERFTQRSVDIPPTMREYFTRLIGEVRELRDREAAVAYMHGLESL